MQHSSSTVRAVLYLALLLFAALFLIPFYLVLVTSFKDVAELRRGNMLSLPETWTVAAWLKAWSAACTGAACNGLRPYFYNSLEMVVPAVLISSVIGAFNGYALAQWHFRGADAIFTLCIIWQFTQIWNDFLFGAAFSGTTARPVTVGLNNLVNTTEGVKEYNV